MYAALLVALADGLTVVTATNRLSRTLQHEYDRNRQQAGASAWQSPDIATWSHWLQRLWQESRLRGGVAQDRVLLDEASVDLLWQQIIAAAEPDRPAASVNRLAKEAHSAWKRVNDWDAWAAPEWTDAGLGADQQEWLRWSGQFRDLCARHQWIDAARLPGLLSADIRAGLFDGLPGVHFAGFEIWPPAWRKLTDAWRERGYLAVETSHSKHAIKIEGQPCQDARLELLTAARWARSCITANNQNTVGVIVPDLANRAAEVRRVFLDIFAPDWRVNGVPAGLPLNVSFGQPLATVPVIHAALLLLQLARRRVLFRDFSLLLRSAWLPGAAAEYTQRGRLDIELRKKLRQQFTLAEAEPLCRKYAPKFCATLDVLLEPETNLGKRTLQQWAESFSARLRSAGWPGDAELDSESWQALKSWNELLAIFAGSGQTHSAGMSRNEALAWLAELAQQRMFQPEGVADGVQVMGALEAAGLEFDQLWVCGMARELWPAVAHPAAFIPLGLQRRLAMPDSTAASTFEHATRVLQRLCSSAPSIVLSWPQQQDGEALHPVDLPDKPPEQSSTLPGKDWPLWNELAIHQGQTELLDQDPPPPLPANQPVRGGATVLDLQAVSPLNAFIEKRLGAALMESPPFGISPRERGNLLHGSLETFYKAYQDRSLIVALAPDGRLAKLMTALQANLDNLPGLDDPFIQVLAEFELEQLLPRLVAFVDLDLQRPEFHVIACEEKHAVHIGPLRLELKLDRFDDTVGGKLVIDYKTGKINRQDWNPAKPRKLQLPLYVTTMVPDAAALAFAQISAQGIQYDGVGVAGFDVDGIRAPGSRNAIEVRYQFPHSDAVISSWEDLRNAWAEVLLELAQQFANGDFRLDPRNPQSARGQFAVLSRIYDSGLGIYEEEA